MAGNWRHSLKQIFSTGSIDEGTSRPSLSPPASGAVKSARRRSLLDLLGQGQSDEEPVKTLSVISRSEDGGGDQNKKSGDPPAPIFTMSSVEDGNRSESSSSSSESSSSEDDDDDATLALGESTQTLTLTSEANLLEDSVEGRLAKLFEDDIEFVVNAVLNMRDGPRKYAFIQEVLRHLRSIRTAATLNTHFLVLSSLVTDIGKRGSAAQEQAPLETDL